MNTINDELVYKVHILHSALNEAQKSLSSLEKENSCLRQRLLDLSQNNNIYKSCLESYSIEFKDDTNE